MLLRTSNITVIQPLALSTFIATALSISMPLSAESVYGPVKSNDTLGRIIKRIYTGPKSSQRSVMKQIVANNPKAFSRGDMNRLKLNVSLKLPGNHWKNTTKSNVSAKQVELASSVKAAIASSVDKLTVSQMKGRIVSLDTERSILVDQMADFKRETSRLEERVQQLELESNLSDERLRILDAEIIRLTALLESKNNELNASSADVKQLVVVQEKLQLVQDETNVLRTGLKSAQEELVNNQRASKQANQAIAQLTQENHRLQQLLQDTQPGVHYYDESSNGDTLSFMSGKFQLPLGLVVVGGVLAILMLIVLLATRRKKKPSVVTAQSKGIDPFEDNHDYNALLEAGSHGYGESAPSDTRPEENVFNMFDEGGLEMDLKLDMAEAYLQVSDFDSARTILQEVSEGGSELQKRKALRLIDRLAA